MDRVLIPFNGVLLALTLEAYEDAQNAARELVAASVPAPVSAADDLLSAEQLAERTNVPSSWWETAARQGRVPHARIGRYIRFRFADVVDHFSRPLDSDSSGAVRQWRKSGT